VRDAHPPLNVRACARTRARVADACHAWLGARPQDDFDPSEPLVKPTEVAAPDETEHNAAVEALKKKIEAGEEKIKALDAEIEVLKGVREKQNAATKELSGELRAFRDKVKEKQVEKDGLQEQLALLTDKKKQMAERIRAQRKQKPKSDDAKIDARIAEIQREVTCR
jgi:chromosome segregation ATPase